MCSVTGITSDQQSAASLKEGVPFPSPPLLWFEIIKKENVKNGPGEKKYLSESRAPRGEMLP